MKENRILRWPVFTWSYAVFAWVVSATAVLTVLYVHNVAGLFKIPLMKPFSKIHMLASRRFQTTSKSTYGPGPPNVNIPSPVSVFCGSSCSSSIRPVAWRHPRSTHRHTPTGPLSLSTKTQVAEPTCTRGIRAFNALYVGQELWCDGVPLSGGRPCCADYEEDEGCCWGR